MDPISNDYQVIQLERDQALVCYESTGECEWREKEDFQLDDAAGHVTEGRSLEDEQLLERAQSEYEKATRMDPWLAVPRLRSSQILFDKGDFWRAALVAREIEHPLEAHTDLFREDFLQVDALIASGRFIDARETALSAWSTFIELERWTPVFGWFP